LEGYAIAATKNQVFEAILIMMLRSLQAISRAFFMINLPSRVQYAAQVGEGHVRWNQKSRFVFPSLHKAMSDLVFTSACQLAQMSR
jgi:hypothetical protein